MGAAEVVATDVVPRPTFDLAASVLGSRVTFRQSSVYKLTSVFPAEGFDVVIFNGVLYHLMAPLMALISINAVLRPEGTLLMESAFYNAEQEKPFIFLSYGPDQIYENDVSSCTFPTPKAFRHMCNMALFTVMRQDCYLRDRSVGRILIEGQKRARVATDWFYEYLPEADVL